MVLKSLKSKIAAGVVGVSLVAGMSTAFAGVDAGQQFKNWYGSLFASKSAAIQTKITTETASQIGAYQREYNFLKNSSTKAVATEGSNESTSVVNAINGQKSTYISQIESAQNQINVAGDFTNFVNTTNGTIDNLKGQAENYAKGDLKNALDAQGTKSVNQVKADASSAQKTATDELTKKISDTKAAIQSLVDEQAATADATIRKHLEDQIAELRTNLQKYAQELVDAKKSDINKAGEAAQADAIAALDILADSIDGK